MMLDTPTLLTASVGVLTVAYVVIERLRRRNAPPRRCGWMPFLGLAIDFGKAPLDFIRKSQDELGSTFTLYIAGRNMTFVTDAADIQTVLNSEPDVSFQDAVQPFTERAAGIARASFLRVHRDIHDQMKGELTPSKLGPYGPRLLECFSAQMAHVESSDSMDLLQFVRKTLFNGAVESLFGRETVESRREALYEHFYAYDKDFEYGTQLPELLLPTWAKSKHFLLGVFEEVAARVMAASSSAPKDPSAEDLMNAVTVAADDSSKPNFLLLLLWASQANSIPASFWVLSFLLHNPHILKQAQEEAQSVSSDSSAESFPYPLIRRCVLETIRLRSPGMIPRKLRSPQKIGAHTIPAGDFLMISPFWAHRNEQMFPNANDFVPDRWLSADLDKRQFINGFIGFGGGRFQCPGRWFALREMCEFVALTLRQFDLSLLPTHTGSPPAPSPLHLVGVQEPIEPLLVKCVRRTHTHSK